MQPGDAITDLIEELDQLIAEGKTPFGGGASKRIIDAEEAFGIIDEIRERFPRDFQDARRILKEEQEILDHAQQQADSIIADAQQQAMIIACDQEIVRLAQQQAEAIREQAQQYERDTRYNAEEYAETVLAHLEDNLKSLSNSVNRVRQTLAENSGPRNTNNGSW